MTTYAYPTLSRPPSSITWGLNDYGEVNRSPIHSNAQVMMRPGTFWHLDLSYDQLGQADARLFEAFLLKLRGKGNRALIPDFSRLSPNGSAGGSPLLKVQADPGDSILHTHGWTISSTGVLLEGDRIQVGNNFSMVTSQVDSDALGEMIIPIRPAISVIEVVSEPIITVNAACRFMLDTNPIQWTVSGSDMSVSVSFVENHV